MNRFLPDLRQALRALRLRPVFSAIAVATLALGIGATTAVFSIVDAVLLRPFGYPEESRLVAIHEIVPKFSAIAPVIPVNALHFRQWRDHARSFSQFALLNSGSFHLTGSGAPTRLAAALVSPSLFPMLGIQPLAGRLFRPEEDVPGRDRVVLISEALWRVRFHSDPSAVGRKILLDGNPYQIVGVVPSHPWLPRIDQLIGMPIAPEQDAQLWKPIAIRDDQLDALGDFDYACIARLKPGVPPGRAQAELNSLVAAVIRQAPAEENIEVRTSVVPLAAQIGGKARGGLLMVLSAVAAVLFIACINIAGLLLARSAGAARDRAVRSALGASAGRLIGQALTESVLLALLGGLAGALLAQASLRLLLAFAPAGIPRIDQVRLDPRALLFTLAVSAAAGLLFGLLPAFRSSRADPRDALQSGSRAFTDSRSPRLLSGLVAAETALSSVCLIAAGLLLHSFFNLIHVDKGFQTTRVLTASLELPDLRYSAGTRTVDFQRSALAALAALPGVAAAGLTNKLPLTGEGNNNLVALEGQNIPLAERPLADIRYVNPDLFRVLGIPLLAGRLFSEADRARPLAVVSARAAARLWPGQSPLGKRFHIGGDNRPLVEVCGVAGDVRGASLNKAPNLTIYFPFWSGKQSSLSFLVQTTANPLPVASAMRSTLARLDPELPVPPIRSLDAILDDSLGQRRFQLNLVLFFAAAALLLAGLGIYGVVSYSVALRTREVGIRMALGARNSLIRRMILLQALLPSSLGLALGLLASLALGRLLSSLLFGLSPLDPLTYAAVIAALIFVSALAGLIPALRAARMDPVSVLRYE